MIYDNDLIGFMLCNLYPYEAGVKAGHREHYLIWVESGCISMRWSLTLRRCDLLTI